MDIDRDKKKGRKKTEKNAYTSSHSPGHRRLILCGCYRLLQSTNAREYKMNCSGKLRNSWKDRMGLQESANLRGVRREGANRFGDNGWQRLLLSPLLQDAFSCKFFSLSRPFFARPLLPDLPNPRARDFSWPPRHPHLGPSTKSWFCDCSFAVLDWCPVVISVSA